PPDPGRVLDLAAFRDVEAVRLFADRARAVVPDFRVDAANAPAVAAITAGLDGLPLAIELAATRLKVLSPQQVQVRLVDRLGLLSSRSRTLPEPHLVSADQAAWLDRCDVERGNLREALRWAVETGRVECAQEAAGALWRFWHQRGHIEEGARWFREILALPSGQRATAARAKAL